MRREVRVLTRMRARGGRDPGGELAERAVEGVKQILPRPARKNRASTTAF